MRTAWPRHHAPPSRDRQGALRFPACRLRNHSLTVVARSRGNANGMATPSRAPEPRPAPGRGAGVFSAHQLLCIHFLRHVLPCSPQKKTPDPFAAEKTCVNRDDCGDVSVKERGEDGTPPPSPTSDVA